MRIRKVILRSRSRGNLVPGYTLGDLFGNVAVQPVKSPVFSFKDQTPLCAVGCVLPAEEAFGMSDYYEFVRWGDDPVSRFEERLVEGCEGGAVQLVFERLTQKLVFLFEGQVSEDHLMDALFLFYDPSGSNDAVEVGFRDLPSPAKKQAALWGLFRTHAVDWRGAPVWDPVEGVDTGNLNQRLFERLGDWDEWGGGEAGSGDLLPRFRLWRPFGMEFPGVGWREVATLPGVWLSLLLGRMESCTYFGVDGGMHDAAVHPETVLDGGVLCGGDVVDPNRIQRFDLTASEMSGDWLYDMLISRSEAVGEVLGLAHRKGPPGARRWLVQSLRWLLEAGGFPSGVQLYFDYVTRRIDSLIEVCDDGVVVRWNGWLDFDGERLRWVGGGAGVVNVDRVAAYRVVGDRAKMSKKEAQERMQTCHGRGSDAEFIKQAASQAFLCGLDGEWSDVIGGGDFSDFRRLAGYKDHCWSCGSEISGSVCEPHGCDLNFCYHCRACGRTRCEAPYRRWWG